MSCKKLICMFLVVMFIISASTTIVQARRTDRNKLDILGNNNCDETIGKVKIIQKGTPLEKSVIEIPDGGIELMGLKFLRFNNIIVNQDLKEYDGQNIKFRVDSPSTPIKKLASMINFAIDKVKDRMPSVNIQGIESIEKIEPSEDEKEELPDETPEKKEDPKEEPKKEEEKKSFIKGSVSESPKTKSLSNVKIKVYSSELLNAVLYEIETDPSGSYEIDISPGDYIIAANKETYETKVQEIKIEAGETKSVNFILEKKPVVLDFNIEDIHIVEQYSGNVIDIKTSLTNNGEYSVRISELNLEKGSLDFEITTPENQIITYTGKQSYTLSSLLLAPGEKISTNIEIEDEENNDFSRAGMYKIQAHYHSIKNSYEETEEIIDIDLTSSKLPFEIKLDKPTIDAMNSFSFELFKEFKSFKENHRRTGSKISNGLIGEFSISPTLFYIYLANLFEGADSETASEMIEVLGIDRNDETVLNTMKILRERYSNNKYEYEISQNNAKWFNEKYKDSISDKYLDTIREYYDSSDYYIDLEGYKQRGSNNNIDTINNWVNEKSNGRIKNIVNLIRFRGGENDYDIGNDMRELDDYRNLSLAEGISTMCFNGEWEKTFDETENDLFHGSRRGPRHVPFMKYEGLYPNLKYTKNSEIKALEIPYKGGDISMIFLSPNYEEGYDISDIYDNMNQKYFEGLRESLSDFNWQDNPVDISIPIFETSVSTEGSVRFKYDMKEYLKNMGITKAFSEEEADFSNMFDSIPTGMNNLFLEGLYQKSYIRVDEIGTETATALDVFSVTNPKGREKIPRREETQPVNDESSRKNTASQDPSDSIIFNANRPFVFILFDKKTGSILDGGDVDIIIISPLVLDLEGDGIKTSSLLDGVLFDLDNDGKKDLTGWTAGCDDSFLALDLDGNRYIDDGGELFGDNTLLSNGKKALNGFEALSQYDSNLDGKIDRFDHVWSDLLLWNDINHNGISEETELKPVTASRVKEIFLEYDYLNKLDNGNLLGEHSTFTNKDGSTCDIIDIWFNVIRG